MLSLRVHLQSHTGSMNVTSLSEHARLSRWQLSQSRNGTGPWVYWRWGVCRSEAPRAQLLLVLSGTLRHDLIGSLGTYIRGSPTWHMALTKNHLKMAGPPRSAKRRSRWPWGRRLCRSPAQHDFTTLVHPASLVAGEVHGRKLLGSHICRCRQRPARFSLGRWPV